MHVSRISVYLHGLSKSLHECDKDKLHLPDNIMTPALLFDVNYPIFEDRRYMF